MELRLDHSVLIPPDVEFRRVLSPKAEGGGVVVRHKATSVVVEGDVCTLCGAGRRQAKFCLATGRSHGEWCCTVCGVRLDGDDVSYCGATGKRHIAADLKMRTQAPHRPPPPPPPHPKAATYLLTYRLFQTLLSHDVVTAVQRAADELEVPVLVPTPERWTSPPEPAKMKTIVNTHKAFRKPTKQQLKPTR